MQHPIPDKRLFIFDADGTLRRCTVEGQVCPNTPEEFVLLPNVKETLESYDWSPKNHTWGIASNQGGIAMGYLTTRMARETLRATANAAGLPDLSGSAAYCPHVGTQDCCCRKPSPFLLLTFLFETDTPRHQALYIGDQPSDREAARRAGIDYIPAFEFFNWPEEAPYYEPTV